MASKNTKTAIVADSTNEVEFSFLRTSSGTDVTMRRADGSLAVVLRLPDSAGAKALAKRLNFGLISAIADGMAIAEGAENVELRLSRTGRWTGTGKVGRFGWIKFSESAQHDLTGWSESQLADRKAA